MPVIAPQTVIKEGLTPVFVPANSGGDVFQNNGLTMLVVKNGGVASVNVTITSQRDCDQGVNHPLVVAVGAGVTRYISNLARDRFNDSDDRVSIGYSAVTSVEVAVLKII